MMKLLSYDEAASALQNGEVIAYPTEGVYGLAADAMNESAVQHLLRIKQRASSRGFIVMSASLEKLHTLIEPLNSVEVAEILESYRGGFRYTWIVPAKSSVPHYLRGDFSTLAIRITNHPDALALCQRMPVGVVSTSANLHQSEPLTSPEAIMALFKHNIAGVMKGAIGGLSSPTRIVDLKTKVVIRS